VNVKELHDALTQALARGINPETQVVFDCVPFECGGEWAIVNEVHDPTDPEQQVIWFTLASRPVDICTRCGYGCGCAEWADSRTTYGHYKD